jgi:hypothetical protein
VTASRPARESDGHLRAAASRLRLSEGNLPMKTNKSPKSKVSHTKKPVDEVAPLAEVVSDEEILAENQLAVVGREDEASSSGHRIEPIINDEEGNAEKLIEEGLHGYQHVSKKQH